MKKQFSVFSTILLALVIVACGSNPYSKTNKVHKKQAKLYAKQFRTFPPEQGKDEEGLDYGEHWVGTTNFNLRKPNYVIIHHTAQNSVDHTLKTFTLKRTSVSSHYVIGEDGKIYQMLNDYYRGWHAGAGKWGNDSDLNSSSIGIELDNNGYEPFSEKQIESLLQLLGVLKERHGIPARNFIGHSDIAPSRKVDPNANFPWERLAENGFGLWYDNIEAAPKVVGDSLVPSKGVREVVVTENEILEDGNPTDTISLTINPKLALRIIGYDVSNMDAAIRAFKLHFIQEDVSSKLTDEDLKILYNLYQKYL
ncbi:N-acetylmuramoyl-L-alanine amidase [Salinimicrobium sp. GXAS 041]|uniref:N-acetylmuramoyl-L-alanine amidase n=1 Tax=Salinimicrobium sp. GXAS 041 TaxID=3400806 RepID=UPI003C74E94B